MRRVVSLDRIGALPSIFVIATGAWTLLFHLAMTVGLTRDVSVAMWLVVCSSVAVLSWKAVANWNPTLHLADVRIGSAARTGAGGHLRILVTALTVVASAASLFDISQPWAWTGTWSAWVIALVIAAVSGDASAPSAARAAAQPTGHHRSEILVPVAAIGVVIVSLLTQRRNADDVFLVNRSVYVEEHGGRFPVRDVLFSDQVFPITRPDFPVSSWEAMIGSLAGWLPGSSLTWTYLVVAPLVAGLGVISMWRLVAVLGVPRPHVVVAVAVLFLALDGGTAASLGNSFLLRPWQGKTVLLIVVLPELVRWTVLWVASGERRSLIMLATCAIAGLGLSSTAVLLVAPIVTASAIGVGVWCRNWHRPIVTLIPLVPILLTGIGRFVADPQPLIARAAAAVVGPPDFLSSPPVGGALVTKVAGEGGVVVAIVASVGAVMLCRGVARLVLASLCLAGLALLAPGVPHLFKDLGVGSIVWRVVWLIPIPLLIGIVIANFRPSSRGRPQRALLDLGSFVVLVGVMIASNNPVLSMRNLDSVGSVAVDLPSEWVTTARLLAAATPEGTTVAGPVGVNWAVSAVTSSVKAINPRRSYLSVLDRHPDFHAEDRRVVTRIVEGKRRSDDLALLPTATDRLGLGALCLVEPDRQVKSILDDLGFVRAPSTDVCEVWSQPP